MQILSRRHGTVSGRAGASGEAAAKAAFATGHAQAYVTLTLADQLCGVPVLAVRDVLANQPIARIPLAPPEVAGNLNLRGRIVTAIDLRQLQHLPPRPDGAPQMSIVTEQRGELYALVVDHVSEVVSLRLSDMERNPPTLPAIWAEHSQGVFRLGDRLMVVLDVQRLLRLPDAVAA